MKKYNSYKESGINWIGLIPSDWRLIKMKYLDDSDETMFLDGDWIEPSSRFYEASGFGNDMLITSAHIQQIRELKIIIKCVL